MSNDTHTEVTSQSWFSRLGKAFKGILLGGVLFLVAFPLLFWNEGRAVHRAQALEEGSGMVISVAANSVDAANDGKLVHVSGKATTNETLSDPAFGITAKGLKLKRKVEIYQWMETSKSKTEKKLGGGTETVTTYSYAKKWSGSAIDSGKFKNPDNHSNPAVMPYQSEYYVAGEVELEAYSLPKFVVDQINRYSTLPISAGIQLPEEIKDTARNQNGTLYIGGNPTAPQVGDMRVSYEVVKPLDVSLIAKQVGNTFEPYRTRSGGSIQLMQTVIHSAESMFESAETSNVILTWILRFVGFIIMALGLKLVFKPLPVIADVLPIAGNIIGAGTGLVANILAAAFSLITIAIAWVFYRPLIGLALIAIAVVFISFTKVRMKKVGTRAVPEMA